MYRMSLGLIALSLVGCTRFGFERRPSAEADSGSDARVDLIVAPRDAASKDGATADVPTDTFVADGTIDLHDGGADGARPSDLGGDATVDVFVPPPGSLDPTFGSQGYVVIPVSNTTSDQAKRVAVDSQGRLVIGGQFISGTVPGNDFFVVRYSAAGVLDSSFGGGIVSFDFGGQNDTFQDLAIDGAGRVVAGGQATVSDQRGIALLRLSDDGTLDSSFGSGGTTFIDASAADDELRNMAFDSQGRIVFAAAVNDNVSFVAGRLSADGVPDASFGTDGLSTAFDGTGSQGQGIVNGPGDLPIVCGHSWQGSANRNDVSVARFSSLGALDPAFGTGDGALFHLGGDELLRGVARDGAGRLVVVGRSDDDVPRTRAFVARISGDGTLDTGFASNGSALLAPGSFDVAFDVLVDSQGRIVVVGETQQPQSVDLFVYRLLVDGTPDGTFAPGGLVIVDLDGRDDHVRGAAFDAQGRLLLAGWFDNGPGADSFVVRLVI